MSRPVVIAATIPAPYMKGDARLWSSWLSNSAEISASHRDGVKYLAIGEGPESAFDPLLDAMSKTKVWRQTITAELHDGRVEITTTNRQQHIVMCQNLAADHAWRLGGDLFMVGAGIKLPADVLLTALLYTRNRFLCGPYVPSYALAPEPNSRRWAADRSYFSGLPAGAVLIPWEALNDGLRWRVSDVSDDYGLQRDALRLGYASLVLHKLVAEKWPATVIPVEKRDIALRRL